MITYKNFPADLKNRGPGFRDMWVDMVAQEEAEQPSSENPFRFCYFTYKATKERLLRGFANERRRERRWEKRNARRGSYLVET